MCDEHFEEDVNKYLRQRGMTRRRFGVITAAAGIAAVLPAVANAQSVIGSEVLIQTPDGRADAYFAHPISGQYPAVLIWPDAMGLRSAFKDMATRLAESGYSVLVVNPYYRSAPAPVVPEGSDFGSARGALGPLMGSLNPQTHVTDALAFVGWLDSQAPVDTSRKVGTMGYCMGGPITMRTAAVLPNRVGAGASFHGGGLVTEGEDSPHLLVAQMQADYLIAIAENDDERDPQVKETLRQAFDATGLNAEIEVYADTMHGWCPTDSAVYHPEQAERAWSRTLALFERALA